MNITLTKTNLFPLKERASKHADTSCFERKPSTGQLHVELNGSGPREVRGKTKKTKKHLFKSFLGIYVYLFVEECLFI